MNTNGTNGVTAGQSTIETTEQDVPKKISAKILIVDDERNIRLTVSMALQGQGYDVAMAEDGDQATKLLSQSDFDIIILDVRLPGRSGLDLLRDWRQQFPNIIIILMSGEASLSEALEGLKGGAFDFLEKPILSARLLKTVSHAAERLLLNRRIDLGAGDRIVGDSPALKRVVSDAQKVAGTKVRVLITGESGTGKDLLARLIHLSSARKDRPFIKINCASIPQDLVESELFGHAKGSFTGATSARKGHFECADGGTIFLDEVGELPLAAQGKMLRTLQSGEIMAVGTSTPHIVDVRVVAATNRDLKKEVEAGRFREDLYYRLAVVTLESPSLRDRQDDIPQLIKYFLAEISKEHGGHDKAFDDQANAALLAYSWPGNVREMRNVIERSVILGGQVLTLADLPPEIASCKPTSNINSEITSAPSNNTDLATTIEPWAEFKVRSEKEQILKAIRCSNGNMSEAARLLKVERQTIYKWLKAYDIRL